MRSFASRHRPWVWILLWGVTIAAALGALLPALGGRGPPPPAWDVAFRLVGGSFAACGLIAWRRRPENRSGRLMVATGLCFLAGPLFEQFDAPVMQTLSLLLSDIWLVLLVVLLLSFPSGRPLRSATDRALVGVLVFSSAVLGPLWLLFFDYPGNLLAVFADADTAHAIDTVARVLVCCASVGTFAVLARRWWAATPPLRRAMLPSLAGGVSLLLLAALLASDIVTGTPTDPVLILTWACVIGLILTPAAFLTGLLRTRLARGGFADLVVELRGLHGAALQAALARTLRDPTLVLAGWLPGVRGLRRRRRPGRAAAGGGERPPQHGDRARRPADRDARPRPLARRRARGTRGGLRGGRVGARERAAPHRVARAARRAAGVTRADRGGRRYRAPAARAQPPRRRAAAARRRRASAAV